MTQFNFGEIVIVEDEFIGVVCKCWSDETYDVYVRSWNAISGCKASELRRFEYDKEIDRSNDGKEE